MEWLQQTVQMPAWEFLIYVLWHTFAGLVLGVIWIGPWIESKRPFGPFAPPKDKR